MIEIRGMIMSDDERGRMKVAVVAGRGEAGFQQINAGPQRPRLITG